ncbi:hypothetical protein C5167_014229 [Papaver somniferum]|uniref:Uncharacterized protein n=1 Tax=Papaver somniferum TaxID=3469 RepID=A0A4Y7J3J7_PAPSO|nr:hypothetical protein C5167_014229 [Papaver somniferum]
MAINAGKGFKLRSQKLTGKRKIECEKKEKKSIIKGESEVQMRGGDDLESVKNWRCKRHCRSWNSGRVPGNV